MRNKPIDRARPLARRLTVASAALAWGCVPGTPRPERAAAPVFVPRDFFAGDTIGDGTLRTVLSRPRPVHVVGHGHLDPDGTLVLDQRVEIAGKPPHRRTWRLATLADGSLTATLSDATGPVAIDAAGNLLHVRFATTGGLGVEQWIRLRPDRQSALNHMAVRKWGIRVATLDETIRRADH